MTPRDLTRARPEYHDDIAELRGRMDDDTITDILERYRAGGMDRDAVMEALDIDFLGMLYELLHVYQIAAPEPDPAEEERQATMMRLLLDGKEVPSELRQPASWRIRH